ncbi:Ig-like domain-containing protein [Escherichia coli]
MTLSTPSNMGVRRWWSAAPVRAAAGDVVTVTLNGKNYTTTLDASVVNAGAWAFRRHVTALATGSQTITASLSDRAGNSDGATHDVTVIFSSRR